MTLDNWYNKPLNLNDIIAGGSLILLAIIFLPIYVVTSIVLYRESRVSCLKRIIYLKQKIIASLLNELQQQINIQSEI